MFTLKVLCLYQHVILSSSYDAGASKAFVSLDIPHIYVAEHVSICFIQDSACTGQLGLLCKHFIGHDHNGPIQFVVFVHGSISLGWYRY